ncbi:MAG: NAD(P)H-dependent oxidoreductase subunit E [Fimbriimonadaceae bacterium]|nr:NAD(P)H-dependent oxidoreductase subunit E [Fimbriimonadaceae bacterium]
MPTDLCLVDALIDEHRGRTGEVIALLEAFQRQFQHLPAWALERAAERLGLSLSHIFGVATFYNAFTLTPRGEHVVKVCLGTACHVAGGRRVLDELERELGIAAGGTTPDGRYSIEVVHCLGACAVAPVVVTDDETHGRMDPSKTRAAVRAVAHRPAARTSETPTPGSEAAAAPILKMLSPGDLDRRRTELVAQRLAGRRSISLCGGPGCRPRGGLQVAHAFREALVAQGLATSVDFRFTGCHGFCEQGPVVVVEPGNVFYRGVQARDAAEVVEALAEDRVVERLLYVDPVSGRRAVREDEVAFYARQTRLLLTGNKAVDPTSLDDALAAGAYEGLRRALALAPEEVIAEVRASGLRGRGGAGFPTAQKWEFCRRAAGEQKVVICNADEGDPGAFMDRSILEGDPHAVIEGMAIGAYAIGAALGVVYVRDEYPLAVEHLHLALQQAREQGLLGENILGSGFNFDLELVRGAGAFVCGEETALIASIEGERGMPRAKPPFPANSGLWRMPTNINNVKTWKFVQVILSRGHQVFSDVGAETCRGTMLFSLVGKVRNPGLVEVPLGTTIRELVEGIGGGPLDKPIKAVQIGGPSGGCIPVSLFDTPLTYEALAQVGGILGSGGVIVLDEDACMVDVARYFVHFTRNESCGKCVPCQMGTQQLAAILDRIVQGEGRLADLDLLERVCDTMQQGSLCGLGKTAPNPVLTTLRYFRHEYLSHIELHDCPAGVCRELFAYWIDPDECVGCSLCRKACATQAIAGNHKSVHLIDAAACVRCGACFEVCPPKIAAVHRVPTEVRR